MSMSDVPRCQHVKVNGTQCGSPALRRKRFCYFHDNYRQTQARLMAAQSEVCLSNLPLLEDANSVQVAVMHVIHLLGSGKLGTKVAGLMLFGLQTASANLKRVNFEAGRGRSSSASFLAAAVSSFSAAVSSKSRSNQPAKLRKKPDPLQDSPNVSDCITKLLMERFGLGSANGEHAGKAEADELEKTRMSQN